MSANRASFAEKRRILQLETIYDLAVALHAHRPEQELVDELLQGVCAALDPAAEHLLICLICALIKTASAC